jgi:flagellar motor switch protein FliG
VEFLLSNMSARMADNLREEMTERGKVKQSDAEDAMSAIITAIRALLDGGTITLVEESEDAEVPGALRHDGCALVNHSGG